MAILPDSRYEKIHTGSAIEIQRLQAILEEKGIPVIIRNDNESAKLAGYALASPDSSRILVDKDYLVKAKHLVASALNDFDQNRIPDQELEQLAQQKPVHEKLVSTNTNLKKPKAPKPPNGLLLFYVAYLVYAGWRFYPMIIGTEEFSIWRVGITGALSLYCIYKLVSYYNTVKSDA